MEDQAHDALFSPATLMLGKIHWTLLRAAHLMDSRRYRKVRLSGESFATEWTEFGNEIGTDEINWWVFKKETQIDDLKAETERVLNPAQRLKEGSAKLANLRPASYDELLSTLREFAEKYSGEIELLYAYARWLEARDEMAPRILFTYRVWGSTRMSDRSIRIPDDAPSIPNDDDLRTCAELALGVRDYSWTTYQRVHSELLYEIYESMDPEQLSEHVEISVPADRVLGWASRKIYNECAVYFEEVRDSLRNILIDIQKFEEQKELMRSDAFWREFVIKAVQAKKTETQLWDFKETLTIWHVKKEPAREHAKVAFAEDVASLANTTGGVLLIGVRDKPRVIVGLSRDSRELENRLKVARDIVKSHIDYDQDIVTFHQVVVPVEDGDKTCLVVIVAQTSGVVGVRDAQHNYKYPVRQETGIERMSRIDVLGRKGFVRSDNYGFMRALRQFTLDN